MQIKIDITEDDFREDLRDFEESKEGRSFLNTMESAARFAEKHSSGIKQNEMRYLTMLTYSEPERALKMLYALGFLHGYTFGRASKEAPEKRNGPQVPGA